MTDLSSTLDGILQKHNARLRQHRRSIADITDEFLKDAYQIQSHISALHSYLKSIRAPYLSTSASAANQRASSKRHQASHTRNTSSTTTTNQFLTTPQRDAIDSESKSTLRDLSSAISRLAATESQRREIRRQIAAQRAAKRFPMGALGRWAAGEEAVRQQQAALTPEEQAEEDREKTTDAWREAVLWYLRKRLGDAAETQRDMMERRVKRELEKSMSVLYKVKGADGSGMADLTGAAAGSGAGGKNAANVALAEDEQGTAIGGGSGSGPSAGAAAAATPEDHGLTAEQLQLFAEENNAMLKHYEDSLDQVRAAEKSMLEISELQTTLAQNLAVQAERIDVLVEDSQRTEENVTGGNRELKQATQRWRPARTMFWVTCGLSGVLVLWDLVI